MDSSSQDHSDSPILGNCLSCQGLVRVPARAPSDSTVRCPHCSTTYRLAEILDQAVPELEILEELQIAEELPRVDQIKTSEREVFVVPSQLSKGAKRSRRKRSSSSGGADRNSEGHRGSKNGEVSNSSSRSTGTSSSASRSQSRSASKSLTRREPPKRNAAVEMAKVIVGGVLAIPIAYLLVLWIFQQDPLHVGPTIGNVVPFLVPADLRGEDEIEDAVSASAGSPNGNPAEPNDEGSLAVPKLDPNRVLNQDLDESQQ